MDYLSNIKHSYTIDFDYFSGGSSCFLMTLDGNISFYDFDNSYSEFDELCYTMANYCDNQLGSPCVAFLYTDSVLQQWTNSPWVLVTSYFYSDYFLLESFGTSGDFKLSSLYHNEDNADIYDCGLVQGYSRINAFGTANSGSVTNYQYDIYFDQDDLFVCDFTNISSYVDGSTTFPNGVDNYLVVRGQNNSFYKYPSFIYLFGANELRYSFGSPYKDIANSEYQRGYGAGAAEGYVNGFDSGYQSGLSQNGGAITTTEANAFSYIGTAFGAVGNIMSLEVLPNITLGLCFSIPMVFVLIMTIFKLVRK